MILNVLGTCAVLYLAALAGSSVDWPSPRDNYAAIIGVIVSLMGIWL